VSKTYQDHQDFIQQNQSTLKYISKSGKKSLIKSVWETRQVEIDQLQKDLSQCQALLTQSERDSHATMALGLRQKKYNDIIKKKNSILIQNSQEQKKAIECLKNNNQNLEKRLVVLAKEANIHQKQQEFLRNENKNLRQLLDKSKKQQFEEKVQLEEYLTHENENTTRHLQNKNRDLEKSLLLTKERNTMEVSSLKDELREAKALCCEYKDYADSFKDKIRKITNHNTQLIQAEKIVGQRYNVQLNNLKDKVEELHTQLQKSQKNYHIIVKQNKHLEGLLAINKDELRELAYQNKQLVQEIDSSTSYMKGLQDQDKQKQFQIEQELSKIMAPITQLSKIMADEKCDNIKQSLDRKI
jgi:hypothetical protein